jgi:hypothetical protein
MGLELYDRSGKPMTSEEYSVKHRDMNYKVVEQTELPNGKWVSTVWLGMDHRCGEGPPIIFETLVFPSKDGPLIEEDGERYETESEAQAGHKRYCEQYS